MPHIKMQQVVMLHHKTTQIALSIAGFPLQLGKIVAQNQGCQHFKIAWRETIILTVTTHKIGA